MLVSSADIISEPGGDLVGLCTVVETEPHQNNKGRSDALIPIVRFILTVPKVLLAQCR